MKHKNHFSRETVFLNSYRPTCKSLGTCPIFNVKITRACESGENIQLFNKAEPSSMPSLLRPWRGGQVQWNPWAGSQETPLWWSTLIVCVWQSTHSESYFSLLQNKRVGLGDSQRACTELKITGTSKTLCDREGRKKRVTESHGITWQCKWTLLETMWVGPNQLFTGLRSSLASYDLPSSGPQECGLGPCGQQLLLPACFLPSHLGQCLPTRAVPFPSLLSNPIRDPGPDCSNIFITLFFFSLTNSFLASDHLKFLGTWLETK